MRFIAKFGGQVTTMIILTLNMSKNTGNVKIYTPLKLKQEALGSIPGSYPGLFFSLSADVYQ